MDGSLLRMRFLSYAHLRIASLEDAAGHKMGDARITGVGSPLATDIKVPH